MDKIKIITDGSCDLSHEVLNKFNINVVPLGVSFGEEHYTAGVDIDNKEFYAKMKESKELPKTFCPSPENFCKEYQCEEDKIIVNKPIGRNPKDRLKMAVVKDGKNAITHFEVIKRYENFTHMKARLETGRTHQIRVHALSINHPLLGDEVYGPKNNKFKLKGQTLHAKKL